MDENDNYLDAENRIKKEVIKEGRFGRKPASGWTCHVKLEANLPTNVNSDYILNNVKDITIDNGNWFLDRMIEASLKKMQIEEESKFIIPLTKAENLNDDKSIKVKIILQSCDEKPNIFDWSDEEKIEAASNFKKDGVELFKQNRIRHAFNKFSQALKLTLLTDINLGGIRNKDLDLLQVALYNNMAGCQLHYKNYIHTLELCNKSLEISPTSKAYYRRGLANLELGDYEKAEENFVQVLKLEPKNKMAAEKIRLVRELDKDNHENYKGIVKKMFS